MRPPAARDRAIFMLTQMLDRFQPRAEWRHTDVAAIVDVLIEAAHEPVADHTEDETRRPLRDRGGRLRRTVDDDGAASHHHERTA